MPLLDHSRDPFQPGWAWTSFHSTWTNSIVGALNQTLLPPNYRAGPQTHVGTHLKGDIGTYRTGVLIQEPDNGNGKGAATAVWAPPRAALAAVVDFTDRDVFEVQVFRGNWRLVAAVELVSPANRDRPSSRRDFYVKCASYLQNRVSVVTVDIVTERQQNLHADLMRFLELPERFVEAVTTPLYAVAYRTVVADDEKTQLELWPEPLAIGRPLPTLPLWIAEDRAVPLDLEATYVTACNWLRIDLPPAEDQPGTPAQ